MPTLSMQVLLVMVGGTNLATGRKAVTNRADAWERIVAAIEAQGGTVHTIDGKVTERRLERALNRLGKAARRGERVGIVLVGYDDAGGFAVENTVIRQPGKRQRAFSDGRIANILGGRVTPGGDIEVGGRLIPVIKQPPTGNLYQPSIPIGTVLDKLPWFLKPTSQVDAGNDGFWVKNGDQWFNLKEKVVGARAWHKLMSGTDTLGYLELEVALDCRRERWYFNTGSWPTTNFRIECVPPGTDMGPVWQGLANSMLTQSFEWRGFKSDIIPNKVFFEGYALSQADGHGTMRTPIYAEIGQNGQGQRVVTTWMSTEIGDLVPSVNRPVFCKHLPQQTPLGPEFTVVTNVHLGS